MYNAWKRNQSTTNTESSRMEKPVILNQISCIDTDYFVFFCYSSVTEMMIGAKMKVIWNLTTCMNMMNILIQKL